MIRKLLLPALAAVLLAGCMAGGYNYRGGSGDYYYGQPSVDYRYYGGRYDYYGYPGYYRRYGYYGYGYPYYPRHYYYRPRPPVVIGPSPGGGDHDRPPARPDRDEDEGAPWRNLDDLRRPDIDRDRPGPSMRRPAIRQAAPRPSVRRPAVRQASPSIRRPSAESRMERMERTIKRARSGPKTVERQPPL